MYIVLSLYSVYTLAAAAADDDDIQGGPKTLDHCATAKHTHGIAVDILSVCLSVCQTRVL